MKIFTKLFSSFLTLLLTSQTCFAAPGLSELVREYQFAMSVEWDQRDEGFKNEQQEKLLKGIEHLRAEGATTQQLLTESLLMIPDLTKRHDVAEAMGLYHAGQLSQAQLHDFLEENLANMQTPGVSWSPLTNVIVGVVVGYAVLKALMLVIYYWDTDPNYGQGGEAPPKP